MEVILDFNVILHIATIALGVVSGIVLFYFGIKSNPCLQPLGIGQLSVSLAIGINFLLVSKLILHWPFLYRFGNIFALIFLPMPFLHLAFYTQKRSWKWYDVFHAIPVLLYIVDYWDFLFLPTSDKLMVLKQEINDLNLVYQFRQSKYFGPRLHLELRTILFSLYWVAQLILCFRWMRSQYGNSSENKVWRNWMFVFLGCQFLLWFPYYLNVLGMNSLTTYYLINSFSVVWVLLLTLALFFYPAVLYGPKSANHSTTNYLPRAKEKAPLTDVDRQKLEEIIRKIEDEMDSKRLFLKPGYTINKFSDEIHLPVYQISKSLNALKGLGFVDYANQKRIQFCTAQFKRGEWLNLTLEAISSECGFTNRNSFNKAFKKFIHQSPSEYRDGLMKKDG